MITMLPGFATLSEFVSGLNGDCGPLATLAAFHCVDPNRWPLTAAALKELDDYEIAHGFSEANGAQNITSLSNCMTALGVAHTLVGYQQFNWNQFHSDLKTWAGKRPIVVEWALAGKLPGDEPAVHFHFSTCGGIDTGAKGDGIGGGYLWCDGDNRADDPHGGQRPPILYTIQPVQAAQPIAYVMITAPLAQPPSIDWEAKYNTLKAAVNAAVGSN